MKNKRGPIVPPASKKQKSIVRHGPPRTKKQLETEIRFDRLISEKGLKTLTKWLKGLQKS